MPLRQSAWVLIVEVLFNCIYALLYVCFCSFLVRLYRMSETSLLIAILLLVAYILLPTFMVSGAGSRLRLPIEGIVVVVGVLGFACHSESMKNGLSQLAYRVGCGRSRLMDVKARTLGEPLPNDRRGSRRIRSDWQQLKTATRRK